MKPNLSIAIMCKNAAHGIAATIKSVQGLSNDIVVYDTGSTDDTVAIAKQFAVRLYQGPWEGYGKTRNTTIGKTKHDWVLTIDSDEVAEPSLVQEIRQLNLSNPNMVYAIRLRNFLGGKEFAWGDWGSDWRIRLFNKNNVRWDGAIIHEKLVLPPSSVTKRLHSCLFHHNADGVEAFSEKLRQYAFLTAQKYHAAGRKPLFVRRYFGPAHTFLRSYVFRLGFLDGWAGFVLAQLYANYTFLKYARLRELYLTPGPSPAKL